MGTGYDSASFMKLLFTINGLVVSQTIQGIFMICTKSNSSKLINISSTSILNLLKVPGEKFS
jgi:hypothetical protein